MNAFAHHHVGQRDASGQHSHLHFAALRLGALLFDYLQRIGSAVSRDDDASVFHSAGKRICGARRMALASDGTPDVDGQYPQLAPTTSTSYSLRRMGHPKLHSLRNRARARWSARKFCALLRIARHEFLQCVVAHQDNVAQACRECSAEDALGLCD